MAHKNTKMTHWYCPKKNPPKNTEITLEKTKSPNIQLL
jgi:hypothetical protein